MVVNVSISSVTYSEARKITTAQYENATIKVEISATVKEGESVNEAYNECKRFVQAKIRERIIEIVAGKEKAKTTDRNRQIARKYNLGDDDSEDFDIA